MPMIEGFYAFVATAPNGDETIMAIIDPQRGIVLPAIAASDWRLAEIKPIVAAAAEAAGIKVTQCRFEGRVDQELIYDPEAM